MMQKFNLNDFVQNNKKMVAYYLIWVLIHFFLLMSFKGEEDDDYGFIEFLFYMISPILIYVIYSLFKQDQKKPQTLLDKFNTLIQTQSKDSNSAVQFYRFGYDSLPKILFENPSILMEDYYKRSKEAVIETYSKSCLKFAELPLKDDIDKIIIDRIESNQMRFFIINFPKVPKGELNGLPVLPPISIVIAEKSNEYRLFVLALGLSGNDLVLREVDKLGNHARFSGEFGKTNAILVKDIVKIINS